MSQTLVVSRTAHADVSITSPWRLFLFESHLDLAHRALTIIDNQVTRNYCGFVRSRTKPSYGRRVIAADLRHEAPRGRARLGSYVTTHRNDFFQPGLARPTGSPRSVSCSS